MRYRCASRAGLLLHYQTQKRVYIATGRYRCVDVAILVVVGGDGRQSSLFVAKPSRPRPRDSSALPTRFLTASSRCARRCKCDESIFGSDMTGLGRVSQGVVEARLGWEGERQADPVFADREPDRISLPSRVLKQSSVRQKRDARRVLGCAIVLSHLIQEKERNLRSF